MSTLTTLMKYNAGSSSLWSKGRKGNKRYTDSKGKNKTFLFVDDTAIYVENPKEYNTPSKQKTLLAFKSNKTIFAFRLFFPGKVKILFEFLSVSKNRYYLGLSQMQSGVKLTLRSERYLYSKASYYYFLIEKKNVKRHSKINIKSLHTNIYS